MYQGICVSVVTVFFFPVPVAGLSPVMIGDVPPEIPVPIPQPMDNGSTSNMLRVSWEPILLDFSPVFYVIQYNLSKPNGTIISGEITVRSFLSLPRSRSPLPATRGMVFSPVHARVHVLALSYPLDYEYDIGAAGPTVLYRGQPRAAGFFPLERSQRHLNGVLSPTASE